MQVSDVCERNKQNASGYLGLAVFSGYVGVAVFSGYLGVAVFSGYVGLAVFSRYVGLTFSLSFSVHHHPRYDIVEMRMWLVNQFELGVNVFIPGIKEKRIETLVALAKKEFKAREDEKA